MNNQPRTNQGRFEQKSTERRGNAIALRLPASLDAQVRSAAGWQSPADNLALRDWVESACKDAVVGATPHSPLPTPHSYTIKQIRVAADRVALTIQPRERLRVQKAFKALLGELLANGD